MQSSKQPPSHGGYPASGGFQGATIAPAGTVQVNINSKPSSQWIPSVPSSSINFINSSNDPKVMEWTGLDDGKLSILFHEHENNQWIRAEFQPDASMSPLESLKIGLLVNGTIGMALSGANIRASVKPVTYIRANNLERHFRFSVV